MKLNIGIIAGFLLAAGVLSALCSFDRAPTWVQEDMPLPPFDEGRSISNIVALGTSLTALYDWPEQFRNALEACLEHPVALNVIAEPGKNSNWGREKLDQIISLMPDLILIEFSINDADMIFGGVSLQRSLKNHESIILSLKNSLPNTKIALMTMTPAFGLRGLVRPRLERYYEYYVFLSHELEVSMVDIYGRWLALGSGKGVFLDGLHPESTKMNSVMLLALFNLVSEIEPNCDFGR